MKHDALAESRIKLPSVQDWSQSQPFRQLTVSCADSETLLRLSSLSHSDLFMIYLWFTSATLFCATRFLCLTLCLVLTLTLYLSFSFYRESDYCSSSILSQRAELSNTAFFSIVTCAFGSSLIATLQLDSATAKCALDPTTGKGSPHEDDNESESEEQPTLGPLISKHGFGEGWATLQQVPNLCGSQLSLSILN